MIDFSDLDLGVMSGIVSAAVAIATAVAASLFWFFRHRQRNTSAQAQDGHKQSTPSGEPIRSTSPLNVAVPVVAAVSSTVAASEIVHHNHSGRGQEPSGHGSAGSADYADQHSTLDDVGDGLDVGEFD